MQDTLHFDRTPLTGTCKVSKPLQVDVVKMDFTRFLSSNCIGMSSICTDPSIVLNKWVHYDFCYSHKEGLGMRVMIPCAIHDILKLLMLLYAISLIEFELCTSFIYPIWDR